MSIEVSDVSKLYGTQKALDKVSFNIGKGEIVGFLGPNGAGKSTMMKIITSYINSSEGKVKVCNLDVQDHSIEVRKKIGYLPEHNPLYLDLYVKEYLAFVAGVHKIKNSKERIAQMIKMVGLEREQHKKIGALSKGYRQRVGLAGAIIHDPEVLILDEPTTGLDPNQIIEIRTIIKTLGEDKTVMMSTHILQEVEAICDRIMILNKGVLVANENKANLSSISSEIGYVIDIEFESAFKLSLLEKMQHVQHVEKVNDHTFKVYAVKDIRDKVFALAVKEKNAVLGLKQDQGSLEQVFKFLTK